jgi:hypothetical protein
VKKDLAINCTRINFSSRDLYEDLAQKNIFCYETERLHRKDLKPKTLRLKRGEIRVRTRDDMIAVVWKDKRDMCLHDPPRERNIVMNTGMR